MSAGTAASAEEKIHSNVDLPTSDTDLPSTEVEDRSSSIVSKNDLEELKSKAEGLEIGIDTRTTAPKEVLRSKVLFSESAVLQVKERDIQWTEVITAPFADVIALLSWCLPRRRVQQGSQSKHLLITLYMRAHMRIWPEIS